MNNSDKERSDLRRRILAAREDLDPSRRAEMSRRVRENVLQIEQVKQASEVMLYVNFRSEVETFPLFAALQQQGILTSAPLTLVRDHRLLAYRITDPALDLRPGYCGIPEPDPTQAVPVDPAAIDVVLLPGSVFDREDLAAAVELISFSPVSK